MDPSLTIPATCIRIIQEQMAELQKQSFIDEVGSVSGNIYHWHATLLGPQNSPFAGGKFVLDIRFQPEHPLKPPRVRFETNIFHPNISPSCGSISMRILRQYWVHRISMVHLFDSIRLMLIEPNLEEAHPDVGETAKMYKNDRVMYESTAREWTQLYAQ
ncbi:hypothetical protein BUALT_Bualt03G0176400 [Buddleja alternifolia]|uniref:UBC core domain-containing protein n=1 Tax=Buddleja alternifolia TaxID=168488 RepID=A0AAV6Y366_9LAMI|nr:hypothetical protein BUALT_Bualt03G0176400 [Buddleja alternifolia]